MSRALRDDNFEPALLAEDDTSGVIIPLIVKSSNKGLYVHLASFYQDANLGVSWTGQNVGILPLTSGGLLINRLISANTTNATNVKSSAGQVYGWQISNTNASVRFFKLYNKATAPTVGTDTPVMTIAIPGNTNGGITELEFATGITFSTGISFALTTGVADSDTTAVAANEVLVNLLFK